MSVNLNNIRITGKICGCTPLLEGGVKVCKIQFFNMQRGGIWGANLGKIDLYTLSGIYDYGSLRSKVGNTKTIFDNMTVETSSTYVNSNFYQPEYAFKEFAIGSAEGLDYWLVNRSLGNGIYTITLPEPVNILYFEYTDWARTDSWGFNYTIRLFDCDDNLVRTQYVPGKASLYVNDIVTVYPEEMDTP